MILTFFLSILISFVTAYLIIRYQHLYKSYSNDHDLEGKQKFHDSPVPRIGGIALLAGIFVAQPPFWLILSIQPIFIGGLLEDLTKNISPRSRLLLSFLSAIIALYGLDIGIQQFGLAWFDSIILSTPVISLVLTTILIGGISHSANIIDGFNGLLLGFSIMAFSIFTWIAWQLDDQLLLVLLISTLGSLLGLFLLNFPKGGIFLGDGGAYLIGFLMAVFSLMLIKRHPQISPWFPLLVLIYPIFETFFSIYRKKFLRGASPGVPDGIHLHMLVYKRIIPKYFGVKDRGWKRNALTSVVMWIFTIPPLLTALFFWERHLVMVSGVIIFCLYYIFFYFQIVRFKFRKKTSNNNP